MRLIKAFSGMMLLMAFNIHVVLADNIDVDVKPWTAPVNKIRLQTHTRVLVSIKNSGSPYFDPHMVNPTTVKFGPEGANNTGEGTTPLNWYWDDPQDNYASCTDWQLILRFKVEDTDLEVGDTTACLYGETRVYPPDMSPPIAVYGCDTVKVLNT